MAKKGRKQKSPDRSPDEDEQFSETTPVAESLEYALDFSVVGIGASAGGLEALQDFFKHMPENPGVAFVVVQHLSPDYKSLMDELLARYTNMKIHRLEDGMEIRPNRIYLITPRVNMTIFKGKLYLTEQEKSRAVNMPIDIFMRSLAQDQGKNAIGVILSGTGSDGTLGIRAIKEHGGMTIVQDDRSAKFDGMPRSSISTGMVDYILTPGEMPEALINYLKHPFIQRTENIEHQITKDEDYLSKIIMLIREQSGVDFSDYKESTVIRRLEKRISINRYDNIEDYVDFLYRNNRELNILYKDLLIGVTRFFRDQEAFDILKEKGLPEVFKNIKEGQTLRVWSIGCSTGEEAYSLAMLLKEYMEEHNINREVKLFATDIDKESIEFAGIGIYPESIVSDVSPQYLSKYFIRRQEGYQVSETIRRMVVFAPHNILKDPPFSKIDLIVCRNMLIYLNNDVQGKILSMLYFSLKKEGILFLGSSESVGELSSGFTPINTKAKIYQQQPGYKPTVNEFFRIPQVQKKNKRELKTVGTYAGRPKSREMRLENIFDELLSSFVPPSVIVDEHYNLIHTIHNVNRFLRVPRGEVSLNILKMLPGEMATMVSSILRRAKKQQKQIIYENIQVPDLAEQSVTLSGSRLDDPKTKEIYFLISFQLKEKKQPVDKERESVETVDVGHRYQERIDELEKELQYTRENLQATVEELETSNEELQSSNEELIASNEELQSTNEELQSVNEELYTVNAEHQEKIEELTQLNNDMNNLLKNTHIGTLFLDSHLRIRKLTEVAEEITNIRESDIGRPLEHISLEHIYHHFVEDVRKVLDTLQPKESEIKDRAGRWFLTRIIPYRTEDNAVDGIIITFIDISQLKQSQMEVQTINFRLEQAMRMGELAWWEWDYKRDTVRFGDQKATMLGHQPEEMGPGFRAWTSLLHPDDYNRTMKAMEDHLKGKSSIYEVTYRLKSKDGKYLWFRDKGGIVEKDSNNQPLRITGIVMNITHEKEMELEKDKTYELIYKTLEYNPVASTIVDEKGQITFANKKAEGLLGISQKQIRERRFDDVTWEITDLAGKPIDSDQLPFSQVMKTQKPVYRYQHYIKRPNLEKRLLSINGAPMFDSHGEPSGVVFTLDDVTEQKKAEQAIKESEEKYRSLFERNRDAILVADAGRNIIDANPALEELMEYSLEEIKGKKTGCLYASESDFREMGSALRKAREDLGFLKLIAYKKKNGEVLYGETSVFKTTDYQGNVAAYVGLIRDVSAQLRGRQDKTVWKNILDHYREGIMLVDENYRILDYNRAFLDVLGIGDKDLAGKASYELIHGTSEPPAHCVTCKALSEKKYAKETYWEPHLNEHIQFGVNPVYDGQGNFEFAVATIELANSQ